MKFVQFENEVYPNYSGIDIKNIDDVGAMYIFKNIKINKQNSLTVLDGMWYVISCAPFYGHYLQEIIAPFLYYKKNIDSSIKLLWVDNDVSEGSDGHVMNNVHSAIKEMLKNDISKIVTNHEWNSESYQFENLVTFFNSSRFIPHFESENFTIVDTYQHKNTILNKCLQEFLSIYKIEDHDSPKKIFISRRKRSELIEKFNDENSFVRHSPKWYHDAIEFYFSSIGYKVYELSGMFIGDQVKLFHNATHVSGISGVGILNSIFCKDGTVINPILSNKQYKYPWENDILPVINVLYEYIDLSDCENENILINQLNDYFRTKV